LIRSALVIEFNFIRIFEVVPNREAIPVRVSPGLTLYSLTGDGFGFGVAEALGLGVGEAEALGLGVGEAEALGLGVGVAEALGLGVGFGVTVGVGVGLTGVGVATGVGAAATLSLTTAVPAPTFEPVGTLAANTASTAIALGPEPFRAT
jgi:hypothetical protein